jgi:hypothetical protein
MIDDYADYETTCPNCGAEDELNVTSLKFTYQRGGLQDICVPLREDGFDFWDELNTRQKQGDCSSEDEVVACAGCGLTFSLGELMTRDATKYDIQVEARVYGREFVKAGSERVALMKATRLAIDSTDYTTGDIRTTILKRTESN